MTSVPTAAGVVAEPVRVRRLTDREGQKLQQMVRRGSTSSVRCRRATMLLASVGGNRVPVVAQLVQADEDTRTSLSRLSNADVELLRRNRARTVLGPFLQQSTSGCVVSQRAWGSLSPSGARWLCLDLLGQVVRCLCPFTLALSKSHCVTRSSGEVSGGGLADRMFRLVYTSLG